MTALNSFVPDGRSLEERPDRSDYAAREQTLHSGAFADVILKSQFFGLIGRRPLTGEQRLMLAVLADAINIVRGGYRSGSEDRRTSFAEAKDWIFQTECRCPLAFEHVCDALGIDAPALRGRIASMISGASDALSVPRRLRLTEGGRVQRLLTLNSMQRRGDRGGRLVGSSG